jgi:adenine-specific DNA-methyltransferase
VTAGEKKMSGDEKKKVKHNWVVHPLKRRLLAEDFVRLRRADEQRRYLASQRRGRIDPNPHQIDAVVFALRRIPEGGCILADEVGLGKTIEAGLVMAQLLAEGKRRILLIVPKSLLGQWQMELRNLFGIEAREGRRDFEAFTGDGVFLVHREFAGGERGAPLLRAADPFDLVVIDEAHEFFANIYKRFDQDGNYKPDANEAQIADRVRGLLEKDGTPVLLLTATPIQNSLAELWGLVQYVEPTDMLLGKLPTFREVFCDDKDKRLVPGQEFELRRRLGSVLQRTLRSQAKDFLEVPFVERQAKLIEYEMSPEEKELYGEVTAWLMEPYLCSFGGKNRRLLLIGFHRRMASSLAALSSSLEKVAERLRKQLAAGAGDSGDELLTAFASDLEEDLEDLGKPDAEQPADAPSRDRIRAELERIEGFIRRARSIPRESKADRLLEALKVIRERGEKGQGTGKAVIFTESLKTQDFLHELLTKNGFLPEEVTLFRGQNNGPRVEGALKRWEEEVGRANSSANMPNPEVAKRLALVHEFRVRSKVFISTEAGAKGLNLQFCENLVNYDLPWNPQRIEQRIGRVHRYGQRLGVTILNLLDRDNEVQRLTFEILSKKLELFGKVLGAADAVLHAPSSDFPERLVWGLGTDFESQLRDIYGQARSLAEITGQLKALRESMDAKRQEFESEQDRAAELIKTRLDDKVREVFHEKYSKPQVQASLDKLDRDIDSLVGAYLTAIDVDFVRTEASGRIAYRISPSPHLPNVCRDGGLFLIGDAREPGKGEPLYPGHHFLHAAVDEARQATSRPFVVELGPSEAGLPESLASHVGRRGRLVVTKLAYRGLEAIDHFLVTALVEHHDKPIELTIETLLALSILDSARAQVPLAVDDRDVDDAIEEAVLKDQSETTKEDQTRFERKLAQLDRYLDDQILVLTRKLAGLERRLAERLRRSVTAPSVLAKEDREIQSLERDISRLGERIQRLQQGEDDDYQKWRDKLYERRFQRPTVERILQVEFRIVGGGAEC